ncbi:MAG TPA: Cys-tRNA(Pro) deacylase [Casimicrobium sp.]|jgi:Cys-tRNA(Pro) deacylase|nr:Cys-tRNA(Pro) deacylase [Burkholderiales bacterium]HPG62019.1 Cys-tRNA(Pro) deacylase [Casimicrobium sp.]HPT56202.1 Cys-tRNA(Pro) deacylase [Casimicrobium sp.]HPV23086.1 Cys-tRNA(Pro) deacylase [Casimicrobium sp.]
MSKPDEYPITQAIRVLRAEKVSFTPHIYEYVEHGGTANSATSLGVDEHSVIKTIVLEDDKKQPLICLQHGDREVSTKNLARATGRKSISPCSPETANRHTGYVVGGTSPFGTRKAIPIFLERSIAELPRIYINGGKRGFLVGIDPAEIVRVLRPTLVDAAA